MSKSELLACCIDICRDVAELPDRESPDDWPEAMLVTADELRVICHSRLEEHLSEICYNVLTAQLDDLRAALRPFAAAAHLLTSAIHNGGIENVREFPTGEEWRTALNLFPEFQGAVRKSPDELRKALGGTNAG